MGQINFDELPQEKPSTNGDLIAKGRYLALVEKAEMKTPKGDVVKPDYLNLQLAIMNEDGTPVGRLWDILTSSAAALARYKLSRLIKATNLPITSSFDLKDLVKMMPGKKFLLDIDIDTKGGPGKERSVVDALSGEVYYPLVSTPVLEDDSPEDTDESDASY
jgi:hypothetical protein